MVINSTLMGGTMGKPILSHRDLEVYQLAMNGAMAVFALSKSFPEDERYSLTDQIRKSTRSVCANLGEAWRRRRYRASFVSKLNDSETEAGETQVWLEIALRSKYIDASRQSDLDKLYDRILGKLVRMIENPEPWLIKKQ